MIKEYGIKDWNSFIQTINGLTWSLARELGPSNICVNAVAPGITKTDMVAALPEQVIAPLIKMIPLKLF
jgi:3-oxoacyl-[acyl-carrier protein] reductase